MSTFTPVQVVCPQCGHAFDFQSATSVNVTKTPALRTAILAGEFQLARCARCGNGWEAHGAFVYIDFTQRLYVGVWPAEAEADWWRHEQSPADAFVRNLGWAAPPIARRLGQGFRVRTVFGLAALREKVIAHDAGLDDAVLEVVKLRLLLTRTGLTFEPAKRPRLSHVSASTLRFECAGAAVEVERSEYDTVGADPVLTADVAAALAASPYCDLGRLTAPSPA